jgi:hypothetical protein
MCSLTRSVTGWRIPTADTHPSEPVGKPRPTSPQRQYDGTLNNVRSLLAAVNTALDDTNNTLYAAQQQIFTLVTLRRALEAALQNSEQPAAHEATEGCTSPSPKMPHYDSPDARTDAMAEDSPQDQVKNRALL